MRRIVQIFRWGASEGLFDAIVVQNLAIIPGLRKRRGGIREAPPVKPVDPAVVERPLQSQQLGRIAIPFEKGDRRGET